MLIVLIAAAVIGPEPATASTMDTYRDRTRISWRCGESADGEIVVCGKRPSVYRLPFREPEAGSRAAIAANTYEERKRLHGRAVDAGGIGSCSTVGPGGGSGCTKGISLMAPTVKLLKAVDILD